MLNERDTSSQFQPLPLVEQVKLAEKHGLETLLFCPHPWALRHVFINQDTGEVVRARCNRWDCLHCGPRKVDMWRQLVKVGRTDSVPHPHESRENGSRSCESLNRISVIILAVGVRLSFGRTGVVNC